MKETHKKHRRGSVERDVAEPSLKVAKREPRSSPESDEEYKRSTSKRHHHHAKHRHTGEKSAGNSSRSREERDRDRDHRRRRDTGHEEARHKNFDQVKVKVEPVDDDDVKERVEPSSSRWDEEEDQSRFRGSGRDSSRGGRGGGRGRGRGGRGGNRGFGNKRFPSNDEDTSNMEWGKKTDSGDKKFIPPADRDKPNFGLSGKLTEDTNTYKGIVIKYSEPLEARVPKRRWRLYPFKGDEALKVLHIHRASAFLLGRERKIVDIALDHPSCSKQHAALQYRLVQYTRDDGSTGKRIRPYIIDLDSANGTFVNNNKIEPRKYVELLERDVLKFGYSSREYVLLHEHSKDDDADDNM